MALVNSCDALQIIVVTRSGQLSPSSLGQGRT
jgi:hypothetical protein